MTQHLRPYEKIIAWQEARKLCALVYGMTAKFPSHEKYCLTKQLRKAVYSVPLNIAEGNSKRTKPDKVRFMDIALASLEEVHCTAQISCDLAYIGKVQFQKIDWQVQRTSYLLMRLRDSLAS